MHSPFYTEIKVRRWRFWFKVRVGFLFDNYAWFNLFQEKGKDLNDVADISPNKMMQYMIYCSAVSWCRYESKVQWFTETDIAIWLSKISNADFVKIERTFIESWKDYSEGVPDKSSGKKKR